MAKQRTRLIRFDWAMKKLLRDKANFDVLEGFLSVLLGNTIKIKQILDSESNKEDKDDKFNRVDILVENVQGELIIIEIQDSKEYDYFHRILYGTSKAITEHIKGGTAYAKVKKIISITIAYFDLGQGKDYVYHGTTQFKGIHKGDILDLVTEQKKLYNREEVYEIYPEYWLLKVDIFDDNVKDKLDEWIYFLKNGEVEEDFTAQGLQEAKEKLDELKLTSEQRKDYKRHLKRLRNKASEQHTKMYDAKKQIEKAVQDAVMETKEKAVLNLYKNGVPIALIAVSLEVSEDFVREVVGRFEERD
jgi:predicted transposase/invertase (TIGR01784 family)